ncbi:MAG: NAD(P)/FAD-dependent oxidoreductase [Prochlorococcaceae cyanobacterium]
MQGWRVSGLRLPLDHSDADLPAAICRRLQLGPQQLSRWRLVKRSVDARRHGQIRLVYSVDVELNLEPQRWRQLQRRFANDRQLQPIPQSDYGFVLAQPTDLQAPRPLVVGAGPCGYFAALLLAQMGLRPVLLERGKAVKQRTADTFGFWRGSRPFDPESNAQFGEGGAGTFSDGKLYSQVSEPLPYQRKVLEELVAAGANPDILTLHHPHIGTFKLATVVRGLRRRIEELGGSIHFESRVEQLLLDADERRVLGVQLANGDTLAARQVVLAPGHSARDLFAALQRQGVHLEAKPFAMGVRIEHPQALIDRARWGAAAGHPRLGPAEYKLVHHCRGPGLEGRSVWSFCMCPGGLVVGATSEAGMVVTNGMSQHSRNERNANSGLVVNVTLDDLAPYGNAPGDPLAGVAFQRHWESKAFALAGGSYAAPSQSVGAFLAAGHCSEPPQVQASYQPAVIACDLAACLPDFVSAALREALVAFEGSIAGYADPGARLTAVETRTSSPVRISRDAATLESVNTPGLYPAGEGAGYAGGILSAAIDGIKVAEQVALAQHQR